MRIAIFSLLLVFSTTVPAHADCTKDEVCSLLGKMSHFEILDKCPEAAKFLAECKKIEETGLQLLPEAKFVDNGNGTVSDTENHLMWSKTPVRDKEGNLPKVSLKDARKLAQATTINGTTGWRLPTLAELATLLYPERVENASGKKAWINPLFDDGRGHYYWTSTTCAEVTVIEDRYQKKICQAGEKGAWLVHFNINAVFWHLTDVENYHVWVVKSNK
ncbi:MAG: hypothetical protein COV67_09200 [Nitrospinae bacterium CG11_big_fil_rev_8_21_14_0_20_56_8]|nr:MAG: hypothetical protein COV67_09200 [Nitrospinae bacterium CG11_big_fil_rev_8_21_14_0_20_56_8]